MAISWFLFALPAAVPIVAMTQSGYGVFAKRSLSKFVWIGFSVLALFGALLDLNDLPISPRRDVHPLLLAMPLAQAILFVVSQWAFIRER
jgi:hypothetical protein